MFRNLKKKLEQGVAQSPLKNVITLPTSAAKDDGQSSANSSYITDLSMNDSSISAYSTPIKDDHSTGDTIIDPAIGQLIDIPLSSDSSPIHATPDILGGDRRQRQLSGGSTVSDSGLFPPLNLSQSFYVPSDVESVTSEFDGSGFTTEGYSKDDLYRLVQKQQWKATKYKSKFKELVSGYKLLMTERDKIKSTLTQSQDRAFRRISELKEQISLDQEAKKDVEQNYQMMLEEQGEAIKVLRTQVNLLKEGKDVPEEAPVTVRGEGDESGATREMTSLREKVSKLESLLNRSRDMIKGNKERLAVANKEKDNLEKTLADKEDLILMFQQSQETSTVDILKQKAQIEEARRVIEELESDKVIAIATVKQKMHESLEEKDGEMERARASLREREEVIGGKDETVKEKERELVTLREEMEALKRTGEEQLEMARDIIRRLKEEKKEAKDEAEGKLRHAEDVVEQEKQSLIQEISRGKAATIGLLQEDTEHRMAELAKLHELALAKRDASWEEKIASFNAAHQEELVKKDKQMEHTLMEKQDEVLRRLGEKEEDMKLAMEERDLQKMAALSQQDDRTDEIMQHMADYKAENIKLENSLSKIQDDYTSQVEKLNTEHQVIVENLSIKLEKSESEYNVAIAGAKQSYKSALQSTIVEKSAENETLVAQYTELSHSSAASKEMLEERVQILISQVEQQTKTSDVSAQRVLEFESEMEGTRAELKSSMQLCEEKENLLQTEKAKLVNLGTEAKKRIRDLKQNIDQSANDYENSISVKEKKFFEELSRKDTEINTLTMKFESEKNKELKEIRDEISRLQTLTEGYKEKISKNHAEYQDSLKKVKDECEMRVKSKDSEIEQVIGDLRTKEEMKLEEIGKVHKDSIDSMLRECEGRVARLDEILSEKVMLEEKLADLQVLLDAANVKNQEISEKRNECDVEMNELRKQIETQLTQAIESQSDEVNVLHDKVAYWGKLVVEREAELARVKEEHLEIVEALRQEHLEHTEEIEIAMRSKLREETKDLVEKHDEEREGIKLEQKRVLDALVDDYQNKVHELEESVEQLQEEIKVNTDELQRVRSDLDSSYEKTSQVEKEKLELLDAYNVIATDKNGVEIQLSELREKMSQISVDVDEKDRVIVGHLDAVQTLESSKLCLEERVSVYESENTNKDEKYQTLFSSLQTLRDELDEKDRNLRDKEREVEDMLKAHEGLKFERKELLGEMQISIDELVTENDGIKEELVSKQKSWNASLQKAQGDQRETELSYNKSIEMLKKENEAILQKTGNNVNDMTIKLADFENIEQQLRKEVRDAQEIQDEQSRLLQEKEELLQRLQERFNKLKTKAQTTIERCKVDKENADKMLNERLEEVTREKEYIEKELEDSKSDRKSLEKRLNESLLELKDDKDNMEKSMNESLMELKEYKENVEKQLNESLLEKEEVGKNLNESLQKLSEDYNFHIEALEKADEEKVASLREGFESQIQVVNEKYELMLSEREELEGRLKLANVEHGDYVKCNDEIVSELRMEKEKQSVEFCEERNRLQQVLHDMECEAKLRSEDLQRSMQNNLSDSQKQVVELHERHSQRVASVEEDWKQKMVEMKQKYVQKLKEMKAQQSEMLSSLKTEYEQLISDLNDENVGKLTEMQSLQSERVSCLEAEHEIQFSHVDKENLQKLTEMQSQHAEIVNNVKLEYEEKLKEFNEENEQLKLSLDNVKLMRDEVENMKDTFSRDISVKDGKLSEVEDKLQSALEETRKVCSELTVSNTKLLRFEELGQLTDDKIENLEKTNQELFRELDIRKEKVEILTSELGHVNKFRDEKQALEERYRDLEKGVVDRDNLISSLRSDLQYAADEQNKLNEDIDRVVLESKTKAVELQKEIDEMNEKHAKDLENVSEKSLAENEGKIADYKKKAEIYLSQMKKQFLAENDASKAEFERKISDFDSTVEKMESVIANLNSDREKLEVAHGKELEDLKCESDVIVKERDTTMQEYETKVQSSEAGQNENLTEIQSLKSEKEALNSRLSLMENDYRVKIQNFETKFTSFENEKSQLSRQLEALTNAAEVERNELQQTLERDLNRKCQGYEEQLDEMRADHSSRVKQLVKEFNAKISAKDLEYHDHFENIVGKTQRDGDRLSSEHKNEMSELYKDLHDKDEHLENVLEEHRAAMTSKEEEMLANTTEYESLITALRGELSETEVRHEEQMEARVAERVRGMVEAHKDEVTGLSAEWQGERRLGSKHNPHSVSFEELLRQNELSLSAIQTGSVDGEKVKQMLIEMARQQEFLKAQHQLEMAELRSQLEMRSSGKPLVATPGERDLFDIYEKEAAEEIQNLELHNMDLESQIAHLNLELKTSIHKHNVLQDRVSKLESDSTIHPDGALLDHEYPSGPLLTEPTEMEYLRNILFEYMMGRETKTLAKVIATVLRFSDDQIRKVITRENSLAQKWLPPIVHEKM